jgi:hypothetical protein
VFVDGRLRGGSDSVEVAMDDEWRPIPEYSRYIVSRLGFVAHRETGEVLRTHLATKLYPAVGLTDDLSGRARIRAHHIVASVFHGRKPFERAHVRHLDGDPTNNRWDNLCWGSAKDNGEDRVRHGTTNPGEANYAAELTDAGVTDIKRRVAAGEEPKVVAADYGIADRYVYGLISGAKWGHHRCDFDAAAKAAVRSPLSAEQIAKAVLLRKEGYNYAEIGRRLDRTRQRMRQLLTARASEGTPESVVVMPEASVITAPALDLIPPSAVGHGAWVQVLTRPYLICEDSTLWDCREQRVVPTKCLSTGYTEVALKDWMGETVRYSLHRIMAAVFLGPPGAGEYLVRHKDSDPTNNHIRNLAWGVERENAADRMAAGTTTRGERSKSAKLTDAKVEEFRAAVASGVMRKMEVARLHGISPAAASLMLSGKTWRHIAMPDKGDLGAPTLAAAAQGELPF